MFDPGLMDMIMRLRSRGVSDNKVLRSFETVPRKYFVSEEMYTIAYDEKSLPIACGQTLTAPLVVAQMTQALDVKVEHKVLEIGTGSGYHAALLSRLCKRVYSVERYKLLVSESEAVLRRLEISNVVIRHGDGRYGWRGQAPFDRILITAGMRTIPDGLIDQLAPGGRLVGVVDDELVAMDKARTKITETIIIPMEIPMIEAGKSKAL